ncbi:MAG: hypothetical protein EPO06_04105 [Burkholderiaceae bacterium]|nr:MAG: hypothetical protein EPO06_04105 [Burkholderiaceae bacterium]
MRLLLELIGARSALALAELRAERAWMKGQAVMKITGCGLLLMAAVLAMVLVTGLLTEIEPMRIIGGALVLVLLAGLGLLLFVYFRARQRRPFLWLTRSIIKSDLARLGVRSLLH